MRLLSAMTVGSLRMMPRPRAYTSVFAVPRSIARSRGRTPVLTRPDARRGDRYSGASARSPRSNSAMLCSIVVGRRLRNSTIAMPMALAAMANKRKATGAPTTGLDPTDGMLFDRPVGSARPVLLLPDRHGLLQRVDAEPRRLERLGAVRRRDDDEHRRFRQLELADAVQQRDALDVGPARPGRVDDLGHRASGRLLVRLVGHRPHAVASFGVVADDAREAHDGARRRGRRPRERGLGRQRLGRQRDPVTRVGVGGRCRHAPQSRNLLRVLPSGRPGRGRGRGRDRGSRRYTRSDGARGRRGPRGPSTRAATTTPWGPRTTSRAARLRTAWTASGSTRPS